MASYVLFCMLTSLDACFQLMYTVPIKVSSTGLKICLILSNYFTQSLWKLLINRKTGDIFLQNAFSPARSKSQVELTFSLGFLKSAWGVDFLFIVLFQSSSSRIFSAFRKDVTFFYNHESSFRTGSVRCRNRLQLPFVIRAKIQLSPFECLADFKRTFCKEGRCDGNPTRTFSFARFQ